MSRFDDTVDQYIRKNTDVLNIPKNSLCQYLFSFQEGTPPVLHESVRLQLLNGIERIAPYIKVNKYFLTGECITPQTLPAHDSDVTMYISFANYNDDVTSQHQAYRMAKKLSGEYIDRTQHKVYYHLYDKQFSLNDVNGAYDILGNKWIKVPEIEDEELDTNH